MSKDRYSDNHTIEILQENTLELKADNLEFMTDDIEIKVKSPGAPIGVTSDSAFSFTSEDGITINTEDEEVEITGRLVVTTSTPGEPPLTIQQTNAGGINDDLLLVVESGLGNTVCTVDDFGHVDATGLGATATMGAAYVTEEHSKRIFLNTQIGVSGYFENMGNASPTVVNSFNVDYVTRLSAGQYQVIFHHSIGHSNFQPYVQVWDSQPMMAVIQPGSEGVTGVTVFVYDHFTGIMADPSRLSIMILRGY